MASAQNLEGTVMIDRPDSTVKEGREEQGDDYAGNCM